MCAAIVLLCLAGSGVACASDAAAPQLPAIRQASTAELRDGIPRLRALVAACFNNSAACDAADVGGDLRVDSGRGYELHWGWLREALTTAKDKPAAKDETSSRLLREADARLVLLNDELGAPAAADTAAFDRASKTAGEVLAQEEFAREGPSWWERLKARLMRALFRFFEGVGRVGALAPWLGRTIEWTLFVGAAVGLLVFVLRSVARQRLRLAMSAAAPLQTNWDREAEDWRTMAERAAATGSWREAIHCLYWAAIILLEGRRAWRHNPTRTPREYVRLLLPGSAERERLGALTRTFESVWYGSGTADANVYEAAHGNYRNLSSDSSRAAAAGQPAA